MTKKLNFLYCLILIFSPCFYYWSVGSIRLIFVPLILVVLLVLLASGGRLRKLPILISYIPMLLFLLVCWCLTGDGTTFFAALVFFLLFFYATTLSTRFYLTFSEADAKKAYLFSALLF